MQHDAAMEVRLQYPCIADAEQCGKQHCRKTEIRLSVPNKKWRRRKIDQQDFNVEPRQRLTALTAVFKSLTSISAVVNVKTVDGISHSLAISHAAPIYQ